MGYFKKAVKGFTWMGALRASTRLIAFIKIAVFARLLTPSQFGLFGIAALALAFLEIITETGINIFLIQGEGKLEEYLNTAWVVSIVRGLLIGLAMVLAAPIVSSFFGSPESYSLLLLISVVPVVRGFINPAIIKFQKSLEFNKEFLLRFSVYTFDAVIAVIIVFITRSADSLVFGLIAGSIGELILSFAVIKPRPKLAFEFKKVKKIVDRGKWVTGAVFFNYLFREGDDIMVGRLLNTASLGLYRVAYKISTLPITEVADVVIKVTFPVYVRISGDTERLKKAFIKSILGVAAVVIPFGFALFIFTEQIVLIILGKGWLGVVPIVKVLAAFGVFRALTSATNPLFFAVKKQQYVTAVTFAGIVGLALTIVPLIKAYGIVGAGISALIGSIAAVPVSLYFLLKLFKRL